MREFNGKIVNQKLLGELDVIWKQYKRELLSKGTTYEDFIRSNTGWTHDEFILWVANGRMPNAHLSD